MAKKSGTPRPARTRSLQQAASTIFVLMTILPFLIFTWIIYTLNAMQNPRVQVGLVLALFVSMLGFGVLRNVMSHTADVLKLLVGSDARDVPAPAPAAAAASGTAAAPAPGASKKPVTPKRAGDGGAAPAIETAAAIGAIQELQVAADTVARRWKRHAEPLIGQDVVVSVSNMDQPETGFLSRVTDDGLILEQPDGSDFGVLWRLVTAIEVAPAPSTEAATVGANAGASVS